MVLSLSVAAALWQAAPRIVAVEEPGYQTVFDAFERMGFRLVGMAIDDEGVVPESLEHAFRLALRSSCLHQGRRTHSGRRGPWAAGERLPEFSARFPKPVMIEDDQFADLAAATPGSLLNEPHLAERVIYVRSFAKAIAPDMRFRPRPTSSAEPPGRGQELHGWLEPAAVPTSPWSPPGGRGARCRPRQRPSGLRRPAPGGSGGPGGAPRTGGVRRQRRGRPQSWIRLMPGTDAGAVIERTAELGVSALGEPSSSDPAATTWCE